MEPLLALLRDFVLQPVPKSLGLDPASPLGLFTQAIAGLVATALVSALIFLAWRGVQIVLRALDARKARKLRAQAPNATLILIGDITGDKRDTSWSDRVNGRLAEDFALASAGAAIRTLRWHERFNGEAGVRRAAKRLRACDADLIVWGQHLGAHAVQIRILAATGDQARAPIVLDFATDKGQPKLTSEMGDAIAFFAAAAVGKQPADIAKMPAATLVALSERLCALLQSDVVGLSATQREQIAAAFDALAIQAVERTYADLSVRGLLCELRRRHAEQAQTPDAWLSWARAVQHNAGSESEAIMRKLAQVAEGEARVWALIYAAIATDDPKAAIETLERLPEAHPSEMWAAYAQTIKAARLDRRWFYEGLPLTKLNEACELGLAAIKHAPQDRPWIWSMMHLEISNVLNSAFVAGADDAAGARAQTILETGLAGLNPDLCPRPVAIMSAQLSVVCSLRGGREMNSEMRRQYFTSAREMAIVARGLIPKVFNSRWAAATSSLAKAILELGLMHADPAMVDRAILLSDEAHAAAPGNESLWSRRINTRLGAADLAFGERPERTKELALQMQTILDEVAQTRTLAPQHRSVWHNHNAHALRLLAQCAEEKATSRDLYSRAAKQFELAIELSQKLGDVRRVERDKENAANMRNLAEGVAQAQS